MPAPLPSTSPPPFLRLPPHSYPNPSWALLPQAESFPRPSLPRDKTPPPQNTHKRLLPTRKRAPPPRALLVPAFGATRTPSSPPQSAASPGLSRALRPSGARATSGRSSVALKLQKRREGSDRTRRKRLAPVVLLLLPTTLLPDARRLSAPLPHAAPSCRRPSRGRPRTQRASAPCRRPLFFGNFPSPQTRAAEKARDVRSPGARPPSQGD